MDVSRSTKTAVVLWAIILVVLLQVGVLMFAAERLSASEALPEGCSVYEDGSATCPADTFPAGEDQGYWKMVE